MDRMSDYEYRCSWCMNRVVLNIDQMVSLLCPVYERRMLERVYPDVNEEIIEAFRISLEHRGD